MIPLRFLLFFTAVVLHTLGAANSTSAAPKYSEAIYSETTKSYFQYVRSGREESEGKNWGQARIAAHRLRYKGVRGRLAVIPNAEVNKLLRDKFPLDTWAWIGLRYICDLRRSLWSNGRALDARNYQNWARQWYRNAKINCMAQPGYLEFMPVYYTPTDKGFRWQAADPVKKFYGFFVEYPTGAP